MIHKHKDTEDSELNKLAGEKIVGGVIFTKSEEFNGEFKITSIDLHVPALRRPDSITILPNWNPIKDSNHYDVLRDAMLNKGFGVSELFQHRHSFTFSVTKNSGQLPAMDRPNKDIGIYEGFRDRREKNINRLKIECFLEALSQLEFINEKFNKKKGNWAE